MGDATAIRFADPMWQRDMDMLATEVFGAKGNSDSHHLSKREPDTRYVYTPPGDSERREVQTMLNENARGNCENPLKYMSEEVRNEKQIVMQACHQDGLALQYASEILRNDEKVVMAAIRQNGRALQFASDSLKRSRELAQAAVQNDGRAIFYVDKKLRRQLFTVLPNKSF